MAKKQWIIGSVLFFLGVVFIIMSALTPMIVDKHVRTKSQKNAELTSDNRQGFWGEIPGRLKEIVFITFNFYHIENPQGVMWKGAVPSLTEKNGYVYQEFSEFVDVDYDGKDVKYFEFSSLKKTGKCVWSNSTHPSDKITTVNVGSFYEWTLLKNIPRERMALVTFYDMFYLITEEMTLEIYTRNLFSKLNSFEKVESLILSPAGFNQNDSLKIFEDPYFGLSQKETIKIWLKALLENLENGKFVIPSNMTGSLKDIVFHFTFTNAQTISLFSQNFESILLSTMGEVFDWYSCEGSFNGMKACDPVYLGSIQWSSSSVTNWPLNNLWSASLSLSELFPYLTGYLEINSYIKSTTIEKKYPNINFSPQFFYSLFKFDWSSGWPIYSKSSLMDVGRMNNFFKSAYAEDFKSIKKTFDLETTDQARVLWDYINAIVDKTALQGKYDPIVYNHLNRGISSELGLSLVGSQSLQTFLQIFSVKMPLTVSSLYTFSTIVYQEGLTCDTLIHDTAPEVFYVCEMPGLIWENSTVGFQKWLAVHWYGLESYQAEVFMNLSGLNMTLMAKLFDPAGSLALNFSRAELELKEYYNCQNYGARCSGEYMAIVQLVNSSISRFLPPVIVEYLGLEGNSSTFYGVEYVDIGLTMPSEYYVFTNGAPGANITVDQANRLFSDSGLFTYQNFQRFFIEIYSKNYSAITEDYQISDPLMFADYLRSVINEYYFNGLITTKTVQEILFDYQDPLLEQRKNMSPLIGGDPTLENQLILLGRNQTRYQWEYVSSDFKHSVHSGKHSSAKTRKILEINGKKYLNYLALQYQGEGPEGPNIALINQNPWKTKTDFKGTNGWAFKPNIDSDTELSFTQKENCLAFDMTYKETKTRSGLKCYRFGIKNSLFKNVTEDPKMENYFNDAPSGLINLTSVKNMPVFLSLPYFLDGDKKMAKLVTYTTPQYNFPEKYKTYFDVEKYSGVPLYQKQQFQYNFLLKPDLMMPNLSAKSIDSVGYFTYLPVYFTQRSYLLTDDHVDKHFKYIKDDQMAGELVFIVGLSVGIALVLASLLYGLKVWINKRRDQRTVVVAQARQPMLLA
jgi:hypothetical protein